MLYVHLVAHTAIAPLTLTTHAVACWLWGRLRRAFPLAIAAMLMPDHLHLTALVESVGLARRKMLDVIRGLRRANHPGAEIIWRPLEVPDVVPDVRHLRRIVRYDALNPCRAGLARDPLEWAWSTHRDAVGAVINPWVDATELARALQLPSRGFAERHHQYVSGDPTVCVSGTPFPVTATPTAAAVLPLTALVQAAASATRAEPDGVRRKTATRRLFLQLAARHGWRLTARLATMCEMDRSTVRRTFRKPADPVAMAAAELCLGDPRLLRW